MQTLETSYVYKHKAGKVDWFCRALSIGFLISGAAYVAASIGELPSIIPCHFDGQGRPNDYGSRYLLWLPVCFSLALFFFFSWLERNPGMYSSRMTKNNLELQYRITTKMLITMNPVIQFMFLMITIFMVKTARLEFTEYINYLVALNFVLIFSHIVYWLIRWSKLS